MDVIAVNWAEAGWSGLDALLPAIGQLPAGARVTVMTHGYRFDPDHPDRSPHHHILSMAPRPGCWKAISWPRHLHMGRAPAHLGIALGWPAVGRLDRVARRAFRVGADLAPLIRRIKAARPDLHINLFAHSLGARVALAALAVLPAHAVARVILLSGAEYRDHARTALDSRAGRTAQVINVRSSENLPFDIMFRTCVPAPHLAALPLSAGLPDVGAWIDLRIDSIRIRAGLAALGHRIPAPATRFCHWSAYLRPGLFPLYRRLLDPSQGSLIASLQALNEPQGTPKGEGTAALSPL